MYKMYVQEEQDCIMRWPKNTKQRIKGCLKHKTFYNSWCSNNTVSTRQIANDIFL